MFHIVMDILPNIKEGNNITKYEIYKEYIMHNQTKKINKLNN